MSDNASAQPAQIFSFVGRARQTFPAPQIELDACFGIRSEATARDKDRILQVIARASAKGDYEIVKTYMQGLSDLRTAIGAAATFVKIDDLEAQINVMHDWYLNDPISFHGWNAGAIIDAATSERFDVAHENYVKTRLRCIGLDTSLVLEHVGKHLDETQKQMGVFKVVPDTLQHHLASWIKDHESFQKIEIRGRMETVYGEKHTTTPAVLQRQKGALPGLRLVRE